MRTTCVALLLGLGLTLPVPGEEPRKPNLVYVLCDDLGYGDVRCLNPEGKIRTPHLDRLAREGMIFTDVHSGSAVCSPTRYGVLTGRYAWRSRLQQGVLGGLSPRLIEPGRMTAASLLKEHGYHTACIGKWHLGLDWVKQEGKAVTELNIETADQVWNVDYQQPFTNGPNALGFDSYFGISASLDMVPYTFLENDRVTSFPTVEKAFAMMLGRGESKTRLGPAAPEFDAADVLPVLTSQAVAYLAERAPLAEQGTPFFLYLPLASPHTPILPTDEWLGKSGLNAYADFVMQTDACIGRLLKTLDELKLAENTLVIVTSDNGCSPQAQYPELLGNGHNPSHVFRGHKADIYEGGHRVPFLARWPGRVPPNSRSDQLLCLTDWLATCAEIVGTSLPADAGEDSVSFLPALLGKAESPLREAVVHHSINGSFAIRQGPWKLALCPGSGGWSAPRPNRDSSRDLPEVQLFNLAEDIGERQNRQAEEPERVKQLTALLQRYIANGRSTPGPRQANAVPIELYKPHGGPPARAKAAGKPPRRTSPEITATFSIVAVDPATGVVGAAVASKYPSVGRVVPYVRAGVGGFCTQHYHVPAWGEPALDALAKGTAPEQVLADLLKEDPHREQRQLAIIDMQGRAAVHNPTEAPANSRYWAAMTGRYYCCQGNTLAGRAVVTEMARAYEETEGSLADRLVAALVAADEAGGDHRGRLAAGIRLAKKGVDGYWLDLHVDQSDDAVREFAQKYAKLEHEAKGK